MPRGTKEGSGKGPVVGAAHVTGWPAHRGTAVRRIIANDGLSHGQPDTEVSDAENRGRKRP